MPDYWQVLSWASLSHLLLHQWPVFVFAFATFHKLSISVTRCLGGLRMIPSWLRNTWSSHDKFSWHISSPDLKSMLSVCVTSWMAAVQCAHHNVLMHLMKSPMACTKVLCRCVLIVITVDSSGLILVLYWHFSLRKLVALHSAKVKKCDRGNNIGTRLQTHR